MDPRNLFDQVLLDRKIEAAAWRRHAPAQRIRFHRQAQRPEDARHLAVGNGEAEHPGKPVTPQQDRSRLRQMRLERGLDHRPGHAAGRVEDQPGGVLERDPGQLRVDTAFEPVRGVGVQAELAAAADDRLGRKVR